MNHTGRVLVVDDEPNVRLVFRTTLEATGYTVVEAADGLEALDRIAEARPALVILDLKMPGGNGLETLRVLRESGDETPAVIITAHGSIPDAVAAMKLGAIDFLSKPLTPETLRKAVAEVVARHTTMVSEAASAWPLVAQVAERLNRAKRALNRRAFADADALLRQAVGLDPNLAEAHHLLGVLRECQESEQSPYHGLSDWFPVGRPRGRT